MDLSRRQVLTLGAAIAAGGLAAACSSSDSQTFSPSEPELNLLATPDLELIALYTAVRRSYPVLDAPLKEIEDQHVAHVVALGGEVPVEPIDVAVAGTSAAAIEQCILAERRAADLHQEACLRGTDPTQVRLLALLSASEASHVPALARLR